MYIHPRKMLLFLDFDGVTHPLSGKPFSQSCLEHIQSAIDGFSVDIVISSSWRENYHLDALREMLGEQLGKKVVGMTPVIEDPFLKFVRYHEVQKYLSDNGQLSTRWLGLDDTRGFYPAEAPIIWCDPRTGMTDNVAKQLRGALAALAYASDTPPLSRG